VSSTLASGARRAARRALGPRELLDEAQVCAGGDVTGFPPPDLPAGYGPRKMDMDDRADVQRWLAVHNEAFGRRWAPDEFRRTVLEHPHYEIQETFFLCDPHGVVGAICLGVFRRNRSIGVGHYGALVPRCQRRGLGTQMFFFRCRRLAERGLTRSEAETQIKRAGTLHIWFACGFEPKYRLDHWNTPDESPAFVRAITRRRLQRIHEEWQSTHVRR
jgi:GNAT superfamily N-acetyltransferase